MKFQKEDRALIVHGREATKKERKAFVRLFKGGYYSIVVSSSYESSLIRGTAYNVDFKTLVIDFQNGKTYAYYNVDPEVVVDLMFAESAGKYFNESIRGEYRFELIDRAA